MAFTKVEDFLAYQKAATYWEAVNELLTKPGFSKDCRLRDQIRNAIDSITANLAEGFEQSTDRGFARFVFIAKGCTAESRTRLNQARGRKHIADEEFRACNEMGNEVARLLTGLAKYLRRSNRRDRGLGMGPPKTGGSSERLHLRRHQPPMDSPPAAGRPLNQTDDRD